jgi:hypothetical protein
MVKKFVQCSQSKQLLFDGVKEVLGYESLKTFIYYSKM